MLTEEQKAARRAAQKRYYEKNRTYYAEKHRNWVRDNPEKLKQHQRKYYEENREVLIEKNKEYAQKNKDKIRVYQRAYNGVPEATRSCPSHCECCGRLPGRRGLVRDHDYETNAFRGWICDDCNLGLGKIGDTLEAARNLVKYLERAECQMKSQELPSPSQAPEPQSNSETSRPA
jgi:hypothetical protein